MLDRHAIHRFIARQRRLLSDTYDAAWADGQDNYDAELGDDEDPLAGEAAAGGGVLLARRKTLVIDPRRKARALQRADASLGRIQHELAGVTPSDEDMAAAQAAVEAGRIQEGEQIAFAMAQAVGGWMDSNMQRFDQGESVAWAGEQAGYAQAADDNGELLEWTTEDDRHVCEDCSALGGMPPMPAPDWPTSPGEGATECSVGCRCSLDVAGTQETRPLNGTEQNALDAIAAKAAPEPPDFAEPDFYRPPPGAAGGPVTPPAGPEGPVGGAGRPGGAEAGSAAQARPPEPSASRAEVEQQRVELWRLLDQGMTVPQAARELGISPRWAYRLRSRGRPGTEPVVKPATPAEQLLKVARPIDPSVMPASLYRLPSDAVHESHQRPSVASPLGQGHYYSLSRDDAARYGRDRYSLLDDPLHPEKVGEFKVPEGVNLLALASDELPFTGDALRQAVLDAGYNGLRVLDASTGERTVVLYDRTLERVGPPPPKGKMDERRDRLFELLDQGKTLKQAAEDMGISRVYASRLKGMGRRGAEPPRVAPKPGESQRMGEIRALLADMRQPVDRTDPQRLIKLGDLINQEAKDREQAVRAAATAERDRLRPLSNRAFREYDAIKYEFGRDAEVRALHERYDQLEAQLKAAWDKLRNVERETRREVLADLRPMGEQRGVKLKVGVRGFTRYNADAQIKTDLAAVKRFFPTDWMRDSNANGGRALGQSLKVVRDTGRAFYRSSDGGARVQEGKRSTLQHELGHRMEYSRGADTIRTAERNFYRYRTQGEQVRPMGAGYRSDEVARKDRFTDLYMGKDYDPARRGDGRAYELLTMGSEALWWKAYWGMDDEMTNWLLGLYAAA